MKEELPHITWFMVWTELRRFEEDGKTKTKNGDAKDIELGVELTRDGTAPGPEMPDEDYSC
jgi:hypothetical protein